MKMRDVEHDTTHRTYQGIIGIWGVVVQIMWEVMDVQLSKSTGRPTTLPVDILVVFMCGQTV